MINSITIKSGDTVIRTLTGGALRISAKTPMTVSASSVGNSVYLEGSLSIDSDTYVDQAMETLETGFREHGFPYVSKLGPAQAGDDGFLPILGGRSVQVGLWTSGILGNPVDIDGNALEIPYTAYDNSTHKLHITDYAVAPVDTYDYQLLFQALLNMRAWLDGMKDNITVVNGTARDRYNSFVESIQSSFGAVPGLEPGDRPAGMLVANRLFYQYIALVYWWNFLLMSRYAKAEAITHPADPAGMVLSFSCHMYSCNDLTSAPFTACIVTDYDRGYNYFGRMTICDVYPKPTATSIDVRRVDKGICVTATMSGPPAMYDGTFVIEVIPYVKNPDSKEPDNTEEDYYKSRVNVTITDAGPLHWTSTIAWHAVGGLKDVRFVTPRPLGTNK